MYYFKANDKDETEYGPLDPDQIREWLKEKRMDNNSLVRKSTDEEWRPLGQVPDWQTSATPAVALPEGMPTAARKARHGHAFRIGVGVFEEEVESSRAVQVERSQTAHTTKVELGKVVMAHAVLELSHADPFHVQGEHAPFG